MPSQSTKKAPPSIDQWLKEAKADPRAGKEGMFLIHNGIVRETPKAKVREGIDDGSVVTGMYFSYDAAKVEAAIAETYQMDGIFCVKVWLNEGQLEVGDDIMYVMIGGDIRPHVIAALQFLINKIKTECVTEIEQRTDLSK
ncbi:MAG: molybdopterin biosynthesis protein [Firmicutes bacterium]|nr:molybdopterin biosynthesis protein [Bacillota bacterium]